MEFIRNYLVAFVVFFAIDIVWLGFIAKNIYDKHLGFIRADSINWPAAIIFYLLFIGGLIFFVINPALEKNSIAYAFVIGGFFGLLTYATYDMTNLATLKDWPVFITVVDLLWGTLLNSMTAGFSFYIIKLLAGWVEGG